MSTTAAPVAAAVMSYVTAGNPPACWVLDTNIVLDLWVFADPHVQALREVMGLQSLPGVTITTPQVASGVVFTEAYSPPLAAPPIGLCTPIWLATRVMRDELARVLTYPHLVRRQSLTDESAQAVLAAYDAAVTWCEPAPKARFVCTDTDDQKFIDLAAAHRATLISKDKAVLRLKKRLAQLGVPVLRVWTAPVPSAPSPLDTAA